MGRDRRDSLSRRQLLAIGAATGVSLAGCSGGGDTSDNTPDNRDNGQSQDTPTQTPTDTPVPEPEITILDENGDEYGEDPELSDSILTLDFGPTDSFESLNMYLESRDHPLNEFEHILFDSEEKEIPEEEGKAKARIPYRDIWEEQRKYIQELFEDENSGVSWIDMGNMWEDAGGPVNIVLEAQANGEQIQETLPAELVHPKRTVDLEAHNRRMDVITETLAQNDDLDGQDWWDYELARKLKGPYVRGIWQEPNFTLGPITNQDVQAEGNFTIPDTGGNRGYSLLIDADSSEVRNFLEQEIGKNDELSDMEIYHNVWEDYSVVGSYVFDSEEGVLLYGLAYPGSESNPKDQHLRRMIESWTGEEDSVADMEFTNNPRYRQAFKPGVEFGSGLDIGFESVSSEIVDQVLNMAEYYPENTEELLGQEHPERYSSPGIYAVLLDLENGLERLDRRLPLEEGWKKFYWGE